MSDHDHNNRVAVGAIAVAIVFTLVITVALNIKSITATFGVGFVAALICMWIAEEWER